MKKLKIVIIGGVAAGASAAAKARRCDETARIIVFEKSADISYANCGLPYYLSGVIDSRKKLLISSAAFFKKRFNVDVRTNSEVTAIDRQAKLIRYTNQETGEQGEETYDKLILAPGSQASIPPVNGTDLPFVFTLKTLEDTDRIHTLLQDKKPRSAVVIGAGLIGMEAAENLALAGIKVAVVEFMPQILSFMDREMADLMARHVESKNIALYTSEKVVAIREDDSDHAGIVITDKENNLPADLVILAVGIRPDTRLARAAGLAIGETGGILVDEHMQTSDPSIWAAGDCVESKHLVTGKPALFPMGAAANKQGRAAGANAAGRNLKVKGFTGTVIVKIFDMTAAKTGLSEKEALAAGFTPFVSYVIANDHAGYYPGATEIKLKTITDIDTGRVLGAQAVGAKGVDKRIDVLATAIYAGLTVEDLMDIDLAYAPPYSSARDPVYISGAVGQNFYNGDFQPITPAKLHERINAGERFTLVDLRTKREISNTGMIAGAIHIPIDELRGRLAELNPEDEIILYCAVGLRSYLGFRILKMNGFRKVLSLTGGAGCWTYPFAPALPAASAASGSRIF